MAADDTRVDRQVPADTVDAMLAAALAAAGYDVVGATSPRRRASNKGATPGITTLRGEATVVFDAGAADVTYEIGPTAAANGAYDFSEVTVIVWVPASAPVSSG